MSEIGVIIPAYHAHNTIKQLLYSIQAQTICGICKIIVIDDCDQHPYDYLITEFPQLNIALLKTAQNSGPGTARNLGINYAIKANLPYIVFCDADDLFYSNVALELLYNKIPNCDLVISNFYQTTPDGALIGHDEYDIWLFGKIYRTSILKQHNITFVDNARANEDVCFNFWYWLCCQTIQKLENYTYLWHWNENSITRTNNQIYSVTSYCPLCENLATTLQLITNDNLIPQEKKNNGVLNRLIRMYIGYNQLYGIDVDNHNNEKRLAALRSLYSKELKKYEEIFTLKNLTDVWNETQCSDFPNIGILQFLQQIKKEEA